MSDNSTAIPSTNSIDEFYLKNKQTIKKVAVVGVLLYLNRRMVRRVVAKELSQIRFEFVPVQTSEVQEAATAVIKAVTN